MRRRATLVICLAVIVSGVSVMAQTFTNIDEVIVVSKTHFDIGYTALASEMVKRYRTTMIDKALDLCDQSDNLPASRQFSWTLPGWPMRQILWDGQSAERRRRLLAALKSQRLVCHALPFTFHTESMNLEDLVRGLGDASAVSRMVNLPLPRGAKLTDVPSHSWILPTLLKNAGIDFLHIGCNPASASPNIPELFWWEGPDGSRLLTMYSHKYYSHGLKPPANWPCKTWLALLMTNDNHGPQTEEEVAKIFEQAEHLFRPDVKIRFGQLEDFADAIMKENPELPVIKMDMSDTWIQGQQSMPVETKIMRNARPKTGSLESLDTLLRLWGADILSASQAVADAYEQSRLYGEHTWGMNGASAGFRYGQQWRDAMKRGHYKHFMASFDEKRAYARKADKLVSQPLDDRLVSLAENVKFNGQRIVVYNPLPWQRDAVVEVEALPGVTALKPVGGGKPSQVILRDGKVLFTAHDLPPMGYRTYVVSQTDAKEKAKPADNKQGVIENAFMKLTVDPARGGIVSLIDKSSDRELVDQSGGQALGQYLFEKFDKSNVDRFLKAYLKIKPGWAYNDLGKQNMPADVKYSATVTTNMVMSVRHDILGSVVKLNSPCDSKADAVSLTIRLYNDLPYCDIEWRIENKTADPLPEGGWLAFPFNIPNPSFRLARPGAVVGPEDIISGANNELYALTGGINILDKTGAGVALCPLDTALVSLDHPGLWRYTRKYTPGKSRVFFNLHNNMWSTNFPLWTDGSWSSRVRLWLQNGSEGDWSMVRRSMEARWPALAATANGKGGSLPAEQTGIELSRPGLLVTAFGKNPDGNGIVLRLWEQTGKGGTCTVTLPKGTTAKTAQPCNLRGEPTGKPLPIKNHSFNINLKPYAPFSIILD